MSKELQDCFFDELHEHSLAKLNLLKNYAVKWMRKVTLGTMQKKCAIIDTFAGTGYYEDGSEGSPIIILREAIDYAKQAQEKQNINFDKIILIFIEKDKKNFLRLQESLEKFLDSKIVADKYNKVLDYSNIELYISNDDFNKFTDNLLKDVDHIIPTLMFIDPFGYKVLDYNSISKIINKYNQCELIINFMYEEINRFFLKEDSEKFKETLGGFYGPKYEEIKNIVANKPPQERRQIIIEGYKEGLKNAGSIFSLDFDIEKKGKIKMSLIFSTKNLNGFDTMKESMFDICNNTDFEYHTFNPQMSLFQGDEEQKCIEELSVNIYNKFKTKTASFMEIKEYAKKHPFIPSKFVKKSLKLLEQKELIKNVIKIDGSKRRIGTFPDDSIVNFGGEQDEM